MITEIVYIFGKKCLIEPQWTDNLWGYTKLFLNFPHHRLLGSFPHLNSSAGQGVIWGRRMMIHSQDFFVGSDDGAYSVIEFLAFDLKEISM